MSPGFMPCVRSGMILTEVWRSSSKAYTGDISVINNTKIKGSLVIVILNAFSCLKNNCMCLSSYSLKPCFWLRD